MSAAPSAPAPAAGHAVRQLVEGAIAPVQSTIAGIEMTQAAIQGTLEAVNARLVTLETLLRDTLQAVASDKPAPKRPTRVTGAATTDAAKPPAGAPTAVATNRQTQFRSDYRDNAANMRDRFGYVVEHMIATQPDFADKVNKKLGPNTSYDPKSSDAPAELHYFVSNELYKYLVAHGCPVGPEGAATQPALTKDEVGAMFTARHKALKDAAAAAAPPIAQLDPLDAVDDEY